MFRSFNSLFLIVGIFGCTTTSVRQHTLPVNDDFSVWKLSLDQSQPEDVEKKLNSLLEEHPNQVKKWWIQFQQGQLWTKTQPDQSCQVFKELSQKENFPLKEVALLKSVLTCSQEHIPQKSKWEKLSNKNWLKTLFLKAQLQYAKQTNSLFLLGETYLSKSKKSVIRKEKASYTRKALEIAQQQNDSAQVQTLKKRLQKISPKNISNPSLNEMLKVAEDYRFHRDFLAANTIYKKILSHKRSSLYQKYSAHLGLRKSFKLQRKKKETLQATKKLANFTYGAFRKNSGFKERYKKSSILLARTLWTQGDPKAATKELRNLARRLKGKTSLSSVYWIRGRIEEEAQNYHSAIRWFQRGLKECSKNCDLKKKFLWYTAWNYKKLEKFHDAHSTLTLLANGLPLDEKPKALFWNAKVLQKMGDLPLAKTLFEQTQDIDPMGYYGLMSQRELYQGITPLPKKNTIHKSRETSFYQSPEGEIALWLISVDETQLASDYLHEKTQASLRTHAQDTLYWKEALHLYQQAQNYPKLLQRIWQLPKATRDHLIFNNPTLIFPQPHKEMVTSSASSHSIPKEWVYSIMRQESLFNHQARSHADAFGLMQLIPSLAERLSQSGISDYKKADDLFRPRINISLGTAHLKELWQKYNGQFVLSTASYNASEKAIRNWVKFRFAGDPLQFIEDIPYAETQKYVKLVLRNFIIYQRLNSSEETMPFPEWCLDNIQSHTS